MPVMLMKFILRGRYERILVYICTGSKCEHKMLGGGDLNMECRRSLKEPKHENFFAKFSSISGYVTKIEKKE